MYDAFYESRMVSMNPGYAHVAVGAGLGNERYDDNSGSRSVEEVTGVAAGYMVAGAMRGGEENAARPLSFYIADHVERHGE